LVCVLFHFNQQLRPDRRVLPDFEGVVVWESPDHIPDVGFRFFRNQGGCADKSREPHRRLRDSLEPLLLVILSVRLNPPANQEVRFLILVVQETFDCARPVDEVISETRKSLRR